MSRPTFLEGALVALACAVGAAVLYTGLRLVLPAGLTLSLVLAALGLGYMLYLIVRSQRIAGRLLLVVGWLGGTGTTLALVPGPLPQAAVQLAMIWIGRVWCFGPRPLAALMDLGLVLTGGIAALWATVHTGSLFLAVWCLMLVQALFPAIPARPGPAAGSLAPTEPDPFDTARRTAEAALRRL